MKKAHICPVDKCVLSSWWKGVDSDHRSRRQQIYSLPPLATREHSHIKFYFGYKLFINGAGGRTRTPDLLITNQLLYQLSYTSKPKCQNNIPQIATNVKRKIEFFYKNFNFSKKHCIYLPLLTVIGICDTIKLIITVI